MAAEHTPLRGDYLVELRLQPLNEVIGVERERETRVLLLAELVRSVPVDVLTGVAYHILVAM